MLGMHFALLPYNPNVANPETDLFTIDPLPADLSEAVEPE